MQLPNSVEMTRILIYTNLFHPDQIAGASLYTDMARYFRDTGYDVRVIGTFAYYPSWKVARGDRGMMSRVDEFDGIRIKRLKMWVPARPTGLTRMLSDFSFLFALVLFGRYKGWVPDVIITAEPMLSQCLAQRFLYLFRRIPRLIIVQDFVVDAALELGILKLPVVSNFLRWMERWALRSATTLTSISDPMVKKLSSLVGADRRVLYIPNWIHKSLEEHTASVSRSVHSGDNVLFYSGNLGMKQGLPQFLDDFEKSEVTGWQIHIHGSGANVEKLRESASGKEWIMLGDLLDEPEYATKLQSVTACLITQQPNVSANFLPSKLLPALASGTPVLAVCDADSPLGIEVRKANCGCVIQPGDIVKLKRVLEEWKQRPDVLKSYSENAKVFSRCYHRDVVLQQYRTEIERLFHD